MIDAGYRSAVGGQLALPEDKAGGILPILWTCQVGISGHVRELPMTEIPSESHGLVGPDDIATGLLRRQRPMSVKENLYERTVDIRE